MPGKFLIFVLGSTLLLGTGSARAEDPTDYFSLSLSELATVQVVTPSRIEQPLWQTPLNTSVISAEQIHVYGYTTVAEALTTLVGSVPGNNGYRASLGLRGLLVPETFNSRILWQLDGHRLNESYFEWSFPDDLLGVDLENVERIEIVRGPSSSLYGSNAFFGVVNVVTRSGADAPGLLVHASTGGQLLPNPDADPDRGLRLFDRQKVGLAWRAAFADDHHLAVWGSYVKRAGYPLWVDYFTATGAGGVADRRNDAEVGKVGLRYRWKELSINANLVDADSGTPMASYGATPDNSENRYLHRQSYAEARLDHDFGNGWLGQARVAFDRATLDRRWHYVGYSPVDRQFVPSEWWTTEASVVRSGRRHNWLAGAEFQHHRTAQTEDYPSEDFASHADYQFSHLAAYLQDEISLDERWFLNLSGRVEDHEYYGTIPTARGAVIYRSGPQTRYRLSYGHSFMNILIHDYLYRSSVQDPPQPETVDLNREQIGSLEFTADLNLSGVNLEASVYWNRVKDLVLYDAADDRYYNGEGYDMVGFEIQADYVVGGFRGYGNAMVQRSRFDSGESLLNSPAWSVKAGTAHRLVGSIDLALEAQVYGEMDYLDRGDLDLRQPAYAVVNANLGGPLPGGIDWNLRFRNLLNQPYGYPVAKGSGGPFPAPGLGFDLGIVAKLPAGR